MLTKRGVKVLIFICIVVFALWLGLVVRENEMVKDVIVQYGYLGIFFGALLSGLSIFAPVPIFAFFPLFVEAGLNPWTTVVLTIFGVTISDMFVYYFGRLGKHASPVLLKKKTNKLTKFLENYHKVSLVVLFFFVAFVPFPNELFIVPMAFLGYRAYSLFIAVFLGNTVFSIISMLSVVSFIN